MALGGQEGGGVLEDFGSAGEGEEGGEGLGGGGGEFVRGALGFQLRKAFAGKGMAQGFAGMGDEGMEEGVAAEDDEGGKAEGLEAAQGKLHNGEAGLLWGRAQQLHACLIEFPKAIAVAKDGAHIGEFEGGLLLGIAGGGHTDDGPRKVRAQGEDLAVGADEFGQLLAGEGEGVGGVDEGGVDFLEALGLEGREQKALHAAEGGGSRSQALAAA